MPSNTAFLGDLPAGNSLASSYDSLGRATDGIGRRAPFEMSSPALSPRDLSSTLVNLRALGIDIDENNAVLKGLRAAIVTNYSLYMLYSAWTALTKARATRELWYATAETVVLAIAQQWKLIAEGFAAAGVTVAFFAMGEKFGTGDWNLPGFDAKNPTERRAAMRKLKTIVEQS